jgi:hypothetical protein
MGIMITTTQKMGEHTMPSSGEAGTGPNAAGPTEPERHQNHRAGAEAPASATIWPKSRNNSRAGPKSPVFTGCLAIEHRNIARHPRPIRASVARSASCRTGPPRSSTADQPDDTRSPQNRRHRVINKMNKAPPSDAGRATKRSSGASAPTDDVDWWGVCVGGDCGEAWPKGGSVAVSDSTSNAPSSPDFPRSALRVRAGGQRGEALSGPHGSRGAGDLEAQNTSGRQACPRRAASRRR